MTFSAVIISKIQYQTMSANERKGTTKKTTILFSANLRTGMVQLRNRKSALLPCAASPSLACRLPVAYHARYLPFKLKSTLIGCCNCTRMLLVNNAQSNLHLPVQLALQYSRLLTVDTVNTTYSSQEQSFKKRYYPIL